MRCGSHFRDCKALLVASLTRVSGAITSVQTVTFTRYACVAISCVLWITGRGTTFVQWSGTPASSTASATENCATFQQQSLASHRTPTSQTLTPISPPTRYIRFATVWRMRCMIILFKKLLIIIIVDVWSFDGNFTAVDTDNLTEFHLQN